MILIKDFITYLRQKKYAVRTQKVYAQDAADFSSWLQAKEYTLLSLEQSHLDEYYASLKQKYVLVSCLKRKIASLRVCLAYLHNNQRAQSLESYKWPRVNCRATQGICYPFDLILTLLQETTLSLEEITQLHAYHINLRQKKIIFNEKKYVISSELSALLSKHIQHEHEHLFPFTKAHIKSQLKKLIKNHRILKAYEITAHLDEYKVDDFALSAYKNYHPRK